MDYFVNDFDSRKLHYRLLLEQTNKPEIDLMEIVTSLTWGDNEGDSIGKLEFTLPQTYIESQQKYADELVPNGAFVKLYCDALYINRYRCRVNDLSMTSSTQEVRITAYDRIYNLSQNEESWFYTQDKTTDYLVKDIMARAETEVTFNYPSVKHPQIITKSETMLDELSDILDYACTQSEAHKPILIMDNGAAIVTERGWNDTVYCFERRPGMHDYGSIINFQRTADVTDIVTRVQFYGKDKSEDNLAFWGSADGLTEYDVMQKIIYGEGGDKTKWDMKREALRILREQGEQKITYQITTPDIPMVRKGHKIKIIINEELSGYYYVLSINHDANTRTMTMKIEPESHDDRDIIKLSPEEEKLEEEEKKQKEEEKKKQEAEKNK